jgi:hypothetical protein
MSELKTKVNDGDVLAFLNSVPDEKKRQDSLAVLELFQEVTGLPPKMWGSSIVGFGSYRYKYASGREGDWPLTGFSPRKQSLTLYITPGFARYEELMAQLGKYKTGQSCLYINKLEDINLDVLRQLVQQSVTVMREAYPAQPPA